MSELANNKSIRKEVQDLGETLGITPNGKTNQQKIRSIGEQAGDGTYATKEYVNTLMSGALKRSIVETLPEEDIDTNTIYMVLDESASQQGNVYNEYLYINNAWELIGTTAMETPHLYNHKICLNNPNGDQYDRCYFSIMTDSATELTFSTLCTVVQARYGQGKTNAFNCTMTRTSNYNNVECIGCYKEYDNNRLVLVYPSTSSSDIISQYLTNLVVDTVTQIF